MDETPNGGRRAGGTRNEAANASAAAHAPVAHEPDSGVDHDVPLGPPDIAAWAAGVVGILAGLAVVAGLFLSVNGT